MDYNCSNCNQIVTENFCSHCGQKKYTRIDKKYIWDEIQYTVLHTNKGFLYSLKSILKNPGKTAREFIDGKRVQHYKPILLTFVLSGISAFISFKILGLKDLMMEFYSQQKMNSQFTNDYTTFTSSYNSIIMLFLIPFFALTTKLAFRKWGHNYYEHIVMNAYILSFYTMVNIIVVYPLMYFFKGDVDVVVFLASSPIFIIPIILAWFFKNFYDEKPLKSIIGRVLVTFLLTLAGLFIFFILMTIFGVVYAVIKGPEAMEYLLPRKGI
jgi:hypothetical protein